MTSSPVFTNHRPPVRVKVDRADLRLVSRAGEQANCTDCALSEYRIGLLRFC